MVSTGLYLLKSCAFVFAFYIPFLLIFRKSTFFNINRAYLVFGLLLSFVLPLHNGVPALAMYSPPDLPFMEPIITQTGVIVSRASETTPAFNPVFFMLMFYLGGVAIRLFVLTRSVIHMLKMKRNGKIETINNLKVVRTESGGPFSFLRYVFLPANINDRAIVIHEAAHIRQYHWVDLLIVEIASIVLWFNPLMIWYKRSLKQQHEFLADQSVIKNGISIEDYLISIKRQLELAIPIPLTSEFYFLSIKNRINMLTKKRTPFYRVSAYMIVVPLIVGLLMAFSFKKLVKAEATDTSDPAPQMTLGLPIEKNSFRMESGYGERMHPVLGVMRLHTGIDLTAKEGVPVVATLEGVVIKAKLADAWGNIVVIQHDGGYSTSYSHLRWMSVAEGDKVQKGQEIGLVGHTGLSSAKDHLHFELLKDGTAIDPIKYLPEIE